MLVTVGALVVSVGANVVDVRVGALVVLSRCSSCW